MLSAHGKACSEAGDPSSGTKTERYMAATSIRWIVHPLSGLLETAEDIAGADHADQGSIAVGYEKVVDLQFEHLADHLGGRRRRRDGKDCRRHDLLDTGPVNDFDAEIFGQFVVNAGV